MTSFAVFDSSLGPCAIAFGGAEVFHVELPIGPAESKGAVEARLRARVADLDAAATTTKLPPHMKEAVSRVQRHLAGEADTLEDIAVDLSGLPPFHRKVYEALRHVAPGKTVSYGELAALAGSPGASRAVGQAMAKNPCPVIVPCHRVLAAGGKAGGFSSAGGAALKERLLEIEGVKLKASAQLALDFDADDAARRLAKADKKLARVIERAGPYRLARPEGSDTFGALLRSIVYQQLTGKAAATIHGRVAAIYGGKITPAAVVATPDGDLRLAGLSGSKVLAVKDLAAKTLDGTVPSLARLRRMDDAAIIEALTAVRGIGKWSVEMLLMFRLGRPDVMPSSDFGVRKGFQITYGMEEMPAEKVLVAHAEKWRPFRSVASWYMWRAVDQSRERANT